MDVSRRGFLKLALATAAVAAVAPSSLVDTVEYVSERDKVQISGIPAGWAVCDGSKFDKYANPELSNVLGTDTLPDMRGSFVRMSGKDEATEAKPMNKRAVYLIKITDGDIYPVGSMIAYFATHVA